MNNGDGSCLSIEETNKLRIELGLAPLETEEKTSDNASDQPKANEFVHVPAINIGEVKSKEKLENKLRIHRESRDRNEMLSKEISLGQGKLESTENFLKKVLAKQAADKLREAQKESEDEDMGVSYERQLYDSNDLSGLTVEHKASRFDLTGPTIVVIKDKQILDDDAEDVLINVNMVDHEKYEKNIKNRKMGLYGSYNDSDDDDDMDNKDGTVLAKYDETINGEKRDKFRLDSRGKYNLNRELEESTFLNKSSRGVLQMFDTEPKLASDYLTPDEMKARFGKRKKKARGMRTAKPIVPKLEPAAKEPMKVKKEEGELAEDDASRTHGTKREKMKKSPELNGGDSTDEDDYRPNLIMPAINILQSTVVNDQLKHEMTLLKKRNPRVLSDTNGHISEPPKQEPVVDTKKTVFASTEEFTKSLYGMLLAKRKSDAEAATQVKEEPVIKPAPPAAKKEVKEEEPAQSSGWQPEEKILSAPFQPVKKSRNFREPPKVPQERKKMKLTKGVLGDDVELNEGIYSTLLYTKNKGYLDENKTVKMVSNPKNKLLCAQHYQEEKIRYDDIDQKCPRRERRNLPETPFQDKTDFTPDIKLDYHDEFGRPQPPKEAFRALSHRFHGKTSGKIKSEKRFKKLQEQSKISHSFGDTEMKSVSRMKNESRFCVPLSGKNSIIPAAIKKTEKK